MIPPLEELAWWRCLNARNLIGWALFAAALIAALVPGVRPAGLGLVVAGGLLIDTRGSEI